MAVRADLKELIAQSAHELYDHRLTWGRDSGDTSVRDPETNYVYILPRPSDTGKIPNWSVVTPADVAVVDLEGRGVDSPFVEPTVEVLTHLRIYQNREDVQAIVHSHGEWTRVFAALRRPLPIVMMDHFKYIGGRAEIPCSVVAIAGSETLSRNVVQCLGPTGKAVLLAAHGAIAVGQDMTEAMSVAQIAEDAARLAVFASLLGKPPAISVLDFVEEEVAYKLMMRQAL